MKARKGLKWLACALVGAASMVLLGCPHNNVIEHDVVSGSGATTGRGSNDGVKLVITNFVGAGAGVNGPARTIAPEHIDLKDQTERDKYLFIAKGTQDGAIYSYGPEFIDITNTGEATLNIKDNGVWDITVEAYDVAAVVAAGTIIGDKAAIMGNPDHAKTIANTPLTYGSAKVMSGSATINLGGGTRAVTLTLGTDAVAGEGTIDVAVHFKTPADVAVIFPTMGASTYTVTAELVDLVSGDVVTGTGGTTTKDITAEVLPNFEYRFYNSLTNAYETKQLNETPGQNKLLSYKLDAVKIPKGKYMLRVKIENTTDNTVLYRADPAFYVDGNRVTKGEIEIENLLGSKPKKPDAFEVYYTVPTTTDAQTGYKADFVWTETDFYGVGYTLEIANITDIYKYEGGNTVVVANGDNQFTGAEALWTTILDDTSKISEDDRKKYVQTLTWDPNKTSTIKRISGSLLAGSTTVQVRLETGSVYSARIRADNGTNNNSDWTYIGAAGAVTQGPVGPTKFIVPETKGIFDLVKISYVLNNVDLYELQGDRSQTNQIDTVGAGGAQDVKVTADRLIQVEEYNPGAFAVLDYAYDGSTVPATAGNYALVVKGKTDIVMSWLGWANKMPGGTELFGPVSGPTPAAGGGWTKAEWKYDGFKDLSLEPAGAGGSSLNVQAEVAGTFDVLSLDTIGFTAASGPGQVTDAKTVEGLDAYSGTATKNKVYRNTGSTKLVVVLGRDKAQNTYEDFKLYVSVGENNPAHYVESSLKDLNGNPITVTSVVAKVQSNLTTLKTSGTITKATADVPAYTELALVGTGSGMRPGEYTLLVEMTTAQGYVVTQQIPMVVLFEDQKATTPTIP